MKITYDELIEKEWLYIELMNSLPDDLIAQTSKDGFYEVKLLVNGIEIEPQLFTEIVSNIEKYIDKEAKCLLRNKFEEVDDKIFRLHELFNEATDKIKSEFNL
jgi:hypothetical protein